MGLNEKIAEIRLEKGTKRIEKAVFLQNGLKFRCQRCAVFCCRLGGPRLLKKDIERLEGAGYSREKFHDIEQNGIITRADGSCIFVSMDSKHGLFRCSIYNIRPTLCRLYPFSIEKLNSDLYVLKLIPCCSGINVENGECVDERFFDEFLKEIFLGLIDSDAL